ncbi:MAG: AlbA family DNA-binding domain-containing protein [Bacteroidota bacterium]
MMFCYLCCKCPDITEQHNIERKEIWKNEYLKWICGFANEQGGKLIIDKNDNGEIVGV